MESVLLAGCSPIDLDHISNVMPDHLAPEIQEKAGDIRLLVLKGDSRFVAQLQYCDAEECDDTMDDLARLQNPPAEFSAALSERCLSFLIVAYASTEKALFQQAVDVLVKADVIQFCIDGSDTIHVLTA